MRRLCVVHKRTCMHYQNANRVETRRRKSDPEIPASRYSSFHMVNDDAHKPFHQRGELDCCKQGNTKDNQDHPKTCSRVRRLPWWYVLILVVWIILQFIIYTYLYIGGKDLRSLRSKKTYSIVWYKPYHAIIHHHVNLVDMTQCPYSNCRIKVRQASSTGGSVKFRSDAIIFQGNNIPTDTVVTRTSYNQVFVFLSYEPPVYIHSSVYTTPQWDSIFNWTMTYRLDSDIVYRYGEFIENTEKEVVEREGKQSYSRIFRKKRKFAAWMVSHCETQSRRENFVRELQQYINVDIFGTCFDGRNCSYENQEQCTAEIERDYKFYLAFENSLCKDYVTEKAYNWTERNIITVVRGPTDYYRHLPLGSYIDASQFKSVKELAFYLMDVAFNEEEYVQYLRVKDQFKLVGMYNQPQIAYCNLCRRLNNVREYRNSYESISEWWNGMETCWTPKDIH